MLQTYVLDPMAGDLCPKHLPVSDNHTLIDLFISYAWYVVPSYALNCVVFPIQKTCLATYGVRHCLCSDPGSAYKTTTNHETTGTPT